VIRSEKLIEFGYILFSTKFIKVKRVYGMKSSERGNVLINYSFYIERLILVKH